MNKSKVPYSIRLLLIIVGIIGILMFHVQQIFTGSLNIIAIILFIIQLGFIEILLRESDIYRTNYFRLMHISVSIFIVGSFFRLMHYAGGDFMLLTAFCSISLMYLARTASKTSINGLDIAKCIWVIALNMCGMFNLFRWKYATLIGWINLLAFLGVFILYIATPTDKRNKKTVQEERTLDQVV